MLIHIPVYMVHILRENKQLQGKDSKLVSYCMAMTNIIKSDRLKLRFARCAGERDNVLDALQPSDKHE